MFNDVIKNFCRTVVDFTACRQTLRRYQIFLQRLQTDRPKAVHSQPSEQ